jgi:hypothetical protein
MALCVFPDFRAEDAMDVKEAVKRAKDHIVELFADENLSNVGLEEVEFDGEFDEWVVTIGFSRPWDVPAQRVLFQPASTPRSYKVLRISNKLNEVVSVRNREAVT